MKTSHILTTLALIACIVTGSAVYTYNPAGSNPVRTITEMSSGYTVVLHYAGADKIDVIRKLLKLFPRLSLTEAKDMVEGAPTVVVNSVSEDDALYIKQALESIGAVVVITPAQHS